MDSQKLNEILSLPKDEKLELIEVLWNSLNEGIKDSEIPEWHKEVLEERLKKIENGEMEFVSWEKVKEMLHERMK
ncbi:MAG: addiction module protein [Bacteroidota bacterium]|nr:addiction module protein [Bacteroidota bacterium]